MGEFPRKSDGRRVFTVEFKRGVVQQRCGERARPARWRSLQGTTNEVATAANGVQESMPYLLSMIDELGGPKTYNHYPVGWAHAMDSPMQWTKQVASHFGG